MQLPTIYSAGKPGELVIEEPTGNGGFIEIKRGTESRAWGLDNLPAARQTCHCHGMREPKPREGLTR